MVDNYSFKVSFIVPVYNVEGYIKECLFSIFEITAFSYEIIIVNDGSIDSSMTKVCDICQQRDNISYIEQENRGLSAARNAGIEIAAGEYLYFVDSDDKISATNLQNLLGVMTGQEDIVIGNFYNIIDSNEIVNFNRIPNGLVGTGRFFLQKYYLKDIYTVVWRNLYRKEFIDKYSFRFMEGVTYEDVEWTPKVLFYANCVAYYNIPIYCYRKREGSIVNTVFTHKKFEDIVKVGNSLVIFTSQFSPSQKMVAATIHDSIAFFVLLALGNVHHQDPSWKYISNGINLFYALKFRSLKYRLLRLLSTLFPVFFWWILDRKFGLR